MEETSTAESQPGNEIWPRVFISYSRADQDFVRRLAASLEERGFAPDWDQTTLDPDNVGAGISAEDEWWGRLQEMIATADTMVFVVSPHSARSQVCDEEIAYARSVGKRVIAIRARPIDFNKAPPRLAGLNAKIAFDGSAGSYDEALDQLTRALLVDVRWMRELARLTVLAERWDASTREADRLLPGDELRIAESWAARRPASAPPIAQLIIDYLEASRDHEEERQAITEVERVRYEEIERVTRSFLEAELRVRETAPPAGNQGIVDEQETELELIRALAGELTRWHPQAARHVKSMGARDGYAEIFRFPCCDRLVRDFLATSSEKDLPSQFRADGCQEIPESIRYKPRDVANPFSSLLVARHDFLEATLDSLFDAGMADEMIDYLAERDRKLGDAEREAKRVLDDADRPYDADYKELRSARWRAGVALKLLRNQYRRWLERSESA